MTAKRTFTFSTRAIPLIAAYQRLFPALFRTRRKMPAGLRAHARYPEELFRVQAEHVSHVSHAQSAVVL